MEYATKWLEIRVKGVDRETRSMEGVASTSMPDYEGEVILPSAWKESLRSWKKIGSRPKFLAYHKHSLDSGHSPVIGTIESMEITDKGLEFKAAFADTALGNEHLELYATQAMDAFSVGFIPQEREHEPEKIQKLLDKHGIVSQPGQVSRVTIKAHILEVSAIVVGMNMGALVKSAGEAAIKALARLTSEGFAVAEDGKAVEIAPVETITTSDAAVRVVFDGVPEPDTKAEPTAAKAVETNAVEPDVNAEIIATLKVLVDAFTKHLDESRADSKLLHEIKMAMDDFAETKAGAPEAEPPTSTGGAKDQNLSKFYLANIADSVKKVKDAAQPRR